MIKSAYIIAILLSVGMLFSCNESKEEAQMKKVANAFAAHYFNWQYKDCISLVTAESKKQLSFLSSNVNEADVEMLRNKESDADVEILNINQLSDTSATVMLKINDVLYCDTIGTLPKLKTEGNATLKLVKHGTWLVDLAEGLPRMAFPQQNETPDPDQEQDE